MRSIKYVSSQGVEIDLSGNGIVSGFGNLLEWEVEPNVLNGKTVAFSNTQKNVSVPFSVYAENEDELGIALDALNSAAMVDVQLTRAGKLYVDDWYMQGWITSSSKSKIVNGGIAAEYTFTADSPFWVREYTRQFVGGGSEQGDLDYPHDYPHDYGNSIANASIFNESVLPSPFRMVVYGPVDRPEIEIGGNVYCVDVLVNDGCYLVIDSMGDGRSKTITLHDVNGATENVFSKREGTQKKGSGSYVFEEVAPGSNEVVWNGLFGFDLTIFEKRFEKRWN